MFAFLRGSVAAKAVDHIQLDVGGVGYEVHVPDTVHRRLVPQQDVTLFTYCHIRQETFQIFGFLREDEKSLFKLLLSVNKVGPKVALAVLSALPLAEFGQAILNSDVKAFTKVSGVGVKMGQRIVLEIKAKLGQDTELSAILGESGDDNGDTRDDVIDALCSLGCTTAEAKKAAAGARKKLGDDARDEDLVKAALQSMARI